MNDTTCKFEGGIDQNSKQKNGLKIACVAVSAMGHFMPLSNCATALREAGHDVYIVTNGNDFIKEKTKGFGEKYGITMVYTDCGLVNDDAFRKPKSKCEYPINTY